MTDGVSAFQSFNQRVSSQIWVQVSHPIPAKTPTGGVSNVARSLGVYPFLVVFFLDSIRGNPRAGYWSKEIPPDRSWVPFAAQPIWIPSLDPTRFPDWSSGHGSKLCGEAVWGGIHGFVHVETRRFVLFLEDDALKKTNRGSLEVPGAAGIFRLAG